MSRLTALLALALWLPPAVGHANAFESATATPVEGGHQIVVTAQRVMHSPRYSVDGDQVRFWFAGMDEDLWIDPPIDREHIRFLRIRPGAGSASLLHLRLSNGKHIDESGLRIATSGRSITIFVPDSRVSNAEPSPLADITVASGFAEAAVAASPTEASKAQKPDADVTAAQPTETGDTLAQAGDEAEPAAPTVTTKTEPLTGKGAGLLPTLAVTKSAADDADTKLTSAPDGPGLSALLLVSLMLFGLYLALRWMKQRTPTLPMSDIQVVAAKRLGNKHQLLLVRALGEDILLSVNGGQTTCISSTPSPGGHAAQEDNAQGLSVLRKLQNRLGKPSESSAFPEDALPIGDALKAVAKKPQKDFGQELLRMAIANGHRPASADTPAPPTPKSPRRALASALKNLRDQQQSESESDAVAGLMKLRQMASE